MSKYQERHTVPLKERRKPLSRCTGKNYFCSVVSEDVEIALINNLPSAVNQKTGCLCNAINLSANMSTLINLLVLCASISLPKRLKSGKKSAEIEEWNSETNGSLVVVPFGI
jgi:hypothetical protein